jgi:hypothetical protein
MWFTASCAKKPAAAIIACVSCQDGGKRGKKKVSHMKTRVLVLYHTYQTTILKLFRLHVKEFFGVSRLQTQRIESNISGW